MDIPFDLYKIFYHAAKHLNYTQAAQELFITQSAVSQAIKSLEKQLGNPLFYRQGRSMKLTWEGQLLYEHVEKAYHLIKSAESKFQEINNLEIGEIRIGASDTICKYFLMNFLEKFTEQYPGVKIRVTNRTSPQLVNLLKSGGLDLAIITLPISNADIQVEPFMEVKDIFVASPKFASLRNKIISIDSLTRYPILLLEGKSATRRNLDRYLEQHGINIVPEIELESNDLLVDFARIGLGIACVLRESALEEIEKGNLFEVKIKEGLPSRKLGICFMKNLSLSRAALTFIQMLQSVQMS